MESPVALGEKGSSWGKSKRGINLLQWNRHLFLSRRIKDRVSPSCLETIRAHPLRALLLFSNQTGREGEDAAFLKAISGNELTLHKALGFKNSK